MAPHNLSEQLLHDLGKQIINGDILPGDLLPKVEVLSEQKGVSRTVIREALKGLTARRLVESSTKVGTAVRPRSDWQWWDPDVLSWASESKDCRDFLLQLTEVRIAIEPAAVRLAAKNASEEDIKKIRSCFNEMQLSLGDESAFAKADYEFHNSILLASHNELMLSLVKTLREALVQSREATIRVLKQKKIPSYEEPSEEVISRHKAIMEAISSRNEAVAYQKMHELLMRVVQLIESSDAVRK
jgi:DNA-binding FadR family transcriptional regulator